MKTPLALLIVLVAIGSVAAAPLPRYELKISPGELIQLQRDSWGNTLHAATFIADGIEYKVNVRLRGSWARSWPKKPLKIFFEHGHDFHDNHCLNLNPAWRDASFVREPLAYHIYAACGVPAPLAQMVRLDVNGEFHGLYVQVEQPDKPLLRRHGLKGAAIYKANSQSNQSDERDLGPEKSFTQHYEKETRKTDPATDLQLFCHELATTSTVTAFFSNRVDVEKYMNYLAAGVLVQNWDCLNKNHFLVHEERGSQRWCVVPWDLDRTLGDHWRGSFDETSVPVFLGRRSLPGPTGWNRMADRFFSDPALRRPFLDSLQQLLEHEFTTEKLFPILDQYEAQLASTALLDRKRWPASGESIQDGIKSVKRFIERRRAFLLREVAKLKRQ